MGLDPDRFAQRGEERLQFAVNISGTIADGQIIDQTTYSWEWDENWEGKTAHRAGGWSAEIRIPIRVLRFDGSQPVQSWGFQAARFIAERQETNLWAYFPRDVATPIAYLGRLEDLRGLKGGGALELIPFGVGYARRQDAIEDVMLGSGFKLAGSAGLNLKWHLANDVTLDAAFNPDFAQVEADQVILNLTNFETFLPEKRPFFLEGNEAFSFPLQVFYSRRIGAAPTLLDGGRRRAAGRRAVARDDLRRRQGGRTPGPAVDAGRAQRAHRGEPGHRRDRCRRVVEPDRGADDGVQRPAPQARARQRRTRRPHRNGQVQ